MTEILSKKAIAVGTYFESFYAENGDGEYATVSRDAESWTAYMAYGRVGMAHHTRETLFNSEAETIQKEMRKFQPDLRKWRRYEQ